MAQAKKKLYIYEDKEILVPCGAQFEQSFSFPFLGFSDNYFSSMILIWVFSLLFLEEASNAAKHSKCCFVASVVEMSAWEH